MFDYRYFDLVRDVRQNKGSILKASVEYIKRLKQDQRKKNYFEEKYRLQEYQNKKLMQKLQVRSHMFISINIKYICRNMTRSFGSLKPKLSPEVSNQFPQTC